MIELVCAVGSLLLLAGRLIVTVLDGCDGADRGFALLKRNPHNIHPHRPSTSM
jgi:hypothetical protein